MKKTSNSTRLHVNRETLRSLTNESLGAAKGGSTGDDCHMTSGSNGSKSATASKVLNCTMHCSTTVLAQ